MLGDSQVWSLTEPWPLNSRDALQVTQYRLIYRMPTANPEFQLVLISPRTSTHIPPMWWWLLPVSLRWLPLSASWCSSGAPATVADAELT